MGLRLLLTEDRVEALTLAERLEAVNRQRQDVEAGIMEAAMRSAEAQMAANQAAIVVAGEGWHPGVVGIVAGRIKERFNRPACVAGIAGGLGKGSGRSVPGLDLGARGDRRATGRYPRDRRRPCHGGRLLAAGRTS